MTSPAREFLFHLLGLLNKMLRIIPLVTSSWILAALVQLEFPAYLRLPFGFLGALLAPGYLLVKTLGSERDIDLLETLAISVGISLVTIVSLAAAMNFTGIKLTEGSITLAIAITATAIGPFLLFSNKSVRTFRAYKPRPSSALIVCCIVIVMAGGTAGLLISRWQKVPNSGAFTEFSATRSLDAERQRSKPTVGRPLTYKILIVNNEYKSVSYNAKVIFQNQTIPIGPFQINHREKRVESVMIVPTEIGHSQLHIELFKETSSDPYSHLVIQVKISS